MSLADHITLYCGKGKREKVYHAEIVKQGDGFVVNVAYGRRGGELTTGTKTPKPVPREEALAIYGVLMLDMLGAGYDTKEPRGDDAPPPPPRAKLKELVWDHPELGRFTYNQVAWVKTVSVPAFKAFKYVGYGEPSKGKCELAFATDDEADLPTPATVALAKLVLEHQKELVTKVIAALWDDFNGCGPDSGMYWHGDLEQVAQGMEDEGDLPPPKKAADLLKLIGHPGITVHKKVFYHDKPIVELSYAAAFEEEHGLGILTDGTAIIGIGYSSDVTPFKKSKRKAPPKKAKRKR